LKLRKRNPRRDKIESNAVFAAKFELRKKKSLRRKLRRKRTIARETAWLVAHGIDPKASEAPVA
jgi:hypothetical protein